MNNSIREFLKPCLDSGQTAGVLLENPDLFSIFRAAIPPEVSHIIMLKPGDHNFLKEQMERFSIESLISERQYIPQLNLLQWECPAFNRYLTMDCEAPLTYQEPPKGRLMSKRLWDFTAVNAKDAYEGGGWVDSYERKKFSQKEMDEFSENVLIKIKPYLTKKTKVLEIGCSSGLTMFKIAPLVGSYHAVDLSRVIINKNREIAGERHLDTVFLYNLAAHELDLMEQDAFDIVIMNSVIQCFPGYNYFRRVIKTCVKLMKENGFIFLGDVMDLDTRNELIQSIVSYKQEHPSADAKLNNSAETYYSKAFFSDLAVEIPEIACVQCTQKIHTIENELTRFRYDVLLQVGKIPGAKQHSKRKQQQGIDTSIMEL